MVQETTHEPFRLVPHGAGFEQQVLLGEVWAPTYRFTLEASPPVDDELGNWYCATHPQSIFTFMLLAELARPGERVTLVNNEFSRAPSAGVLNAPC